MSPFFFLNLVTNKVIQEASDWGCYKLPQNFYFKKKKGCCKIAKSEGSAEVRFKQPSWRPSLGMWMRMISFPKFSKRALYAHTFGTFDPIPFDSQELNDKGLGNIGLCIGSSLPPVSPFHSTFWAVALSTWALYSFCLCKWWLVALFWSFTFLHIGSWQRDF